MLEKIFNPDNTQHKKVEDLPVEHQKDFINIEGGFVRKEAWESFLYWEEKAKESNERRNIFKKIFKLDKKTFLDFAHKDANKEYEKIRDVEVVEEKMMIDSFEKILPKLYPFIENHSFDAIISEEKSGRFPAEVFKNFINKVYQQKSEKPIDLYPIEAGRELHDESYMSKERIKEKEEMIENQVRKPLRNLLENELLGHGFLYVTEYIHSGTTVGIVLENLNEIIGKLQEENSRVKLPDAYCFISMQQYFDIHPSNLYRLSDPNFQYKYIVGTYDSYPLPEKYKSDRDYYKMKNEKARENKALIEKVSNAYLEIYNNYKQAK